MKTISLIIMVSIVLEALVEYAKTIGTAIEDKEYKTAATQAITIALGIFLAFTFHLQLFNEALSEIYQTIQIDPNIDMVLTGILFSRGSNYFSDFVSKLTSKQDTYLEDYEIDTIEDDEAEDESDTNIVEVDESEEAEG